MKNEKKFKFSFKKATYFFSSWSVSKIFKLRSHLSNHFVKVGHFIFRFEASFMTTEFNNIFGLKNQKKKNQNSYQIKKFQSNH